MEQRKVQLYIPHQKQQEIINDPKRFKVVVCGRKFGKTYYGANELLHDVLTDPDPVHPYWYVAPYYNQAKSILWEYLKHQVKQLPGPIQRDIRMNEQELSLAHKNGGRLLIKGADKEDSLRGPDLKGVVMDEYAFTKPNVWNKIIGPMLSVTKGWAVFIGTPNGYNHFWEMYDGVAKRPDIYKPKFWSRFHYTSYDNPFVDKEYVANEKLRLDEDTFAQEYMAEFKKFAGQVYKEFDRTTHVIDIDHPDPSWVCYRSIDFGQTNPTAVLFIGVDRKDNIYIYDEIYQNRLYTSELARLIKAKGGSYYVRSFGDSSAAQSIKDLNEYGIYVTPVVKTQGSRMDDYVKNGIEKVRERLRVREGTGQPKIFVASHCKNTIMEFENYQWQVAKAKDDINKAEKPEKANDHAMDALRYFIYEYQRPQEKIRIPQRKPSNSFTGY